MDRYPFRTLLILALFSAGLTFVGCEPGGSSGTPDFAAGDSSSDASVAAEPTPELSVTGEQRIVYHVGPVDLPAGAAAMLEKPLVMRFQSDEPVWVTGFVPRVVDNTGAELPSELLHQAIVSNLHEENPLCPAGAGGGNPFLIATSLLTEVELPDGFGYPLLADDPIEARVTLANPTEESFAEVYFSFELVARPMNEFVTLSDVKPMLLELDPCGHEPLEVEPEAFVERSATFRVADEASLIVAHGALQQFGASVALTADGESAPFWETQADLDAEHRIVRLADDPFEDPAGVHFQGGDPITISVAYDNRSTGWLSGATAAAMVYLAPK